MAGPHPNHSNSNKTRRSEQVGTSMHAHNKAKTRQRQRGATLLEVLISVFLLAMIGLVSADTVFRAHQTKKLVTGINDRYHSARVVLDRMARELASAYIAKALPGPDQSRLPQTLLKAKDDTPLNKVTFTSFSHIRMVRNAKEADQAVITYYGKPHPKKSRVYRLFRRHKTNIDGKPEEGGIAYELLDNVVKLEFRYWDRQKTEWVREWDTEKIEYRNRLPPMVQIRLVLQDENGKDVEFMTRTRIFMRTLIQR